METFSDAYDEKIRPLMDKIDQARSLLSSNEDGIKFPSVVVVGDQSSGKSTLLEALSLVELPKGSGIVTRCPLVLRLRKATERKVYRLLDENRKDLLDEANIDILQYIEEETKKLAGAQKNVVNSPIEIQVEDPNVRNLTLIDLPGIARNPIADQPKDILKQTTDLIRHFIKQEESVILCVFPANVDVATVESFRLAGEVDPDGIRTIGVITKADLATSEEVLTQQLLMDRDDVLKLKLGFVAVRNRAMNEKISLADARKREKEFFKQHLAFSSVGWDSLGVEALISRLADLYSDRIKDTFPKMREEIHKKLKAVREQLSKFPPSLETRSERLGKYYELADFYVENILQVHLNSSNDGKRQSIVNIFHGKFEKLKQILAKQEKELLSPAYREKVRNAVSACFGEQLPNFLPHSVLTGLISEKIDQLYQIIDVLIHECFQLTMDALTKNDKQECSGDILLLKMLPFFRSIAGCYMKEKLQEVRTQLQQLIRLEKHNPYTINSYYSEIIKKFREHQIKTKLNKSSTSKTSPVALPNEENKDLEAFFDGISNDEQAVDDMMISVCTYWRVLLKRFIDYAALSIRAGCVFDTCHGVRTRLRQIPVEQPDYVDLSLAEDTLVRNKRKTLQQTKTRLEKVNLILGGDIVSGEDNDGFQNVWESEILSFNTVDELADNSTASVDGNFFATIYFRHNVQLNF